MVKGVIYIAERIKKGYEELEQWKKDHPNCVGKVFNPFSRVQIDVYTNVDPFESPLCFVLEHSYEELGEHYTKWVDETRRKLLENRTKSELKFSRILSQSNTTVIEQPFFKIDNKGYFLDFYLPVYGLAFELNGKVHKGEDNEWHDINRDLAFHSIGIRTIRLSNLDIEADDIKSKIDEWANMAMSGIFDPSSYYRRADMKKFDGKETRFEKLHKEINRILSKKKYANKSVIIFTTETYLSGVLTDKRYDTNKYTNKALIDEFFDIIEKNNISVRVYFDGNLKNMKTNIQRHYIESNKNAMKGKIDYVIKISGSDIKEERFMK